MEKLNALWDRWRGVVGLGGWLTAVLVSTTALANASGWGPIPTPAARIAAVDSNSRFAHTRIDALSTSLQLHAAASADTHQETDRILQALKIDLCLRHADVATRARMQLDCDAVLRGRP